MTLATDRLQPTRQFHTIGAIQAERDRMLREDDHARFGALPAFPARQPCPSELCDGGRVPLFGTVTATKPCEVCGGAETIPGLPLNRADVRRIAGSFPRVFRKRVFGRIHQVHRPQRGTTANA